MKGYITEIIGKLLKILKSVRIKHAGSVSSSTTSEPTAEPVSEHISELISEPISEPIT